MEADGHDGVQQHQRPTVHHHQVRTVNMDVIVDTKIHEHHVFHKIVDQRVCDDIV